MDILAGLVVLLVGVATLKFVASPTHDTAAASGAIFSAGFPAVPGGAGWPRRGGGGSDVVAVLDRPTRCRRNGGTDAGLGSGPELVEISTGRPAANAVDPGAGREAPSREA